MVEAGPQITRGMLAEGVKHIRLARESGCDEAEDFALAAVIYSAMAAAQAIEAQRAKTENTGSVACDESAVAKGDAPNLLPKDSPGISTPIRGE